MKFITHSYDEETGLSKVTIQHLGVKFTGYAKVHPTDKDNASELVGGNFAEMKATIKALKYERQLAKQKADEALDFVKAVENYAKFNKDDAAAKSMYRQLNQRIKKVNDLADEINELYETYFGLIKQRDKVLDNLQKKTKEDN